MLPVLVAVEVRFHGRAWSFTLVKPFTYYGLRDSHYLRCGHVRCPGCPACHALAIAIQLIRPTRVVTLAVFSVAGFGWHGRQES